MKILICGEYGIFCKELIGRMKKERHDVFVITGSEKPKRERPHSGVFQDYNFSYRSKSIGKVMKNIDADAMIILGSCDVKFTWKEKKQEAVKYLTGMTNLLLNGKEAGIPEIIYCSTLNTYEDSEIKRTYKQVEELCEKQQEPGKPSITTIHFPEIYGESRTEKTDICAELMEELWERDEIEIYGKCLHRILYVKDAVDALMRVFSKKDRKSNYFIEGSVHTERELLSEIKKVIGERQVNIKDKPGAEEALPAVEEPEKEAMGFYEKYTLKEGLSEYYKLFTKEREANFYKENVKAGIRKKLLPLAENVGLFLIVTFISAMLRSTWLGEHVNFYLFYVAIIATVYGCSQALISSLFVLIVRVLGLFLQGMDIEYIAFADILQILIVGVITGYMHDKYKRRSEDLEDEKRYFQSELLDMTKIYDGNRCIKEMYEQRLLSYEMSMAKVYELSSSLDFWEPQRVVFQAIDVAKELLQVEDVAIYIAGKDAKYLRLTASSSELARSMGKSICVDEGFFMYNELIEKNVFCNRDMKAELPTYACGIFAENSLIAIIMIWTQDLTKINLYESNMLALLGKLIENSMGRARIIWNEYLNQYLEGTAVLQEESFEKILTLCKEGREQNKVIYSLLRIPQETVEARTEELYSEVSSFVRETDFVGKRADGLYIILMNANEEETDYVKERFNRANIVVENISDRG